MREDHIDLLLKELLDLRICSKGCVSTRQYFIEVPTFKSSLTVFCNISTVARKQLKRCFFDKITDIFSGNNQNKYGAIFLSEHLCKNYQKQFMHGSVLAGYSNYRTMTEVETTGMWAEAKIGPGRRRIISSHLKMANNGVSVCAPKHKINEIADRREQPERVCGSEKLKSTKTWKLGKGVVHTKVTEDSKRCFFSVLMKMLQLN